MEIILSFMDSYPISIWVLGGALGLLILAAGMQIGRSFTRPSVPSNVAEAGQMNPLMRVCLGLFTLALGLTLSLTLIFIWPPDGPLADQRPFQFTSVFGTITLERAQQMWLIAGISGMLGAFLHACVSFADFVGNRNLVSSWGWWYLMRGPVGAALGMLFYAITRSGAMQLAGVENFTPYAVVSLCGLAGLSSQQSLRFLQNCFVKLLPAPAPNNSNPLGTPLVITAIDPQRLRTQHAGRIAITAAGINSGTQPYLNNVHLRTAEPDRIAHGVLVAEIDPDQIPTRGTYDLVLRNSDGSVSSAAKVKIEDGPGSGPPPTPDVELHTKSVVDAATALAECEGRGMTMILVLHGLGVAPVAGETSLQMVRQVVANTPNVLIRSLPLSTDVLPKRMTAQLLVRTNGDTILAKADDCDGYVIMIDRGGYVMKVLAPPLDPLLMRAALEQAVAP